MTEVADKAADLLESATAALPHGKRRRGQETMARGVADAIESRRHLVVQAGTGTGKTLAYLVGVLASGRRTVVSTVTKALQDQLAIHDLPHAATALEPELGRRATWAVVKGRSNYVCRQRLSEALASNTLLDDAPSAAQRRELERLARFAADSDEGDLDRLDWVPTPATRRLAVVTSDECPGSAKCPEGANCFAEHARDRAASADVIVTNSHLYALDVATDGAILPEHDVVVFDEAHQLEDVVSASVSSSIGPATISHLSSIVRGVLVDGEATMRLEASGRALIAPLAAALDRRLATPLPRDVAEALSGARLAVHGVSSALALVTSPPPNVAQRLVRAEASCSRVLATIDEMLDPPPRSVCYVEGTAERPVAVLAPLDVAPALAEGVWSKRTAILTSATVPIGMPNRIGLPDFELLDVGSPFDYENQGLLYCPRAMPEPNAPGRDEAVRDELARLIAAAGGRTLALFTTWRAMRAAADALDGSLPGRLLRQDDLPKPALIEAFATDETSSLFATAGFFQGVDVPGRSLSLVVIDKIPFPRPDQPLLAARRDEIGSRAFTEIDVPIAATALAQAAGRLIRSERDRGVVAILDPRIATRGYGRTLLSAVPSFSRTTELDAVRRFLDDSLS